MAKLNSLQYLRAFAALFVVLFHLGQTMARPMYFNSSTYHIPFSFGDFEVELFFVLSGFVIFLIHERDLFGAGDVKQYLLKRFVRIYPPFLIVFLSVYLLAYFSTLRDTLPTDYFVVLKSLLLLPQDKALVGGTGATVIGVAWTLHYEMFFYFFFAAFIAGRVIALCATMMLIFVVVLSYLNYGFFPFDFFSSQYLPLFFMGSGTAWLFSRFPNVQGVGAKLVLVALLLLTFINGIDLFMLHLFTEWKVLFNGFAFSFLILGLTWCERCNEFRFGNKFILMLGEISFSLYLIHTIVISILCKMALNLNIINIRVSFGVLFCVFILFSSIACSWLFHKLIEKPVIGYLSRSFIAR